MNIDIEIYSRRIDCEHICHVTSFTIQSAKNIQKGIKR